MPGLLPDIDPEGLLEFSVVYTDRALNHMSKRFQGVMTDISAILKEVYQAHSTVVIPGSGTYGMEAVARQYPDQVGKLYAGRNGIIGALTEDLIDTSVESAAAIAALRHAIAASDLPGVARLT